MKSLAILGIISTIISFIPIVLILFFKLFRHRSFFALSIYYLLPGIYNLAQEHLITLPPKFYHYFGLINNLLDAPLMLVFLCFFSYSSLMTKRIRLGIYFFLLFEVIVLVITGLNVKAITTILGPGILAILPFSFFLFLRQVRLTIIQQKALGKALMISSVLSSYIIYLLIYLFYYVLKTPNVHDDVVLMYYVVSLLSTLLMSSGLIIENKRIKKLKELQNTRKELASIYGKTKTAVFKNSRFLKPGRS